MAVTITDIAREVGVSFQVVSKVLNGGKSGSQASEKTAQRIREAADRMGYRVNTAARAMSTGKLRSVGLVLSSEYSFSSLVSGHLQGLYGALEKHNLQLSVHVLPDKRLVSDDELPRLLREHTVDGLLINYTHRRPPALDQLIDKHHLPAVQMNVKSASDCVYPDDLNAGVAATRHLIDMGHRRIGYLSFIWGSTKQQHHYSVHDRCEGYRQAMLAAGLEPDVFEYAQEALGSKTVELAREWLDRPDRPTAIVTYCYPHAVSAEMAAISLGMTLPDDLSVVSFDDQKGHQAGGPTLTVWMIPVRETVIGAAEMLVQRMKQNAPCDSIAVPFVCEPGESCVPPR